MSDPASHDPDATARALATVHDAATLARALLARLRAEGREARAAAVQAALAEHAIIMTGPPNPGDDRA